MPQYSVILQRASASSTLAMGVLQASTTARRISLFDLIIGSEATPADNVNLWAIDRVTADGSMAGGSAATPAPLDPADPASLATALTGTITTNPTIGARLAAIPCNQRATFRWVAAPGGELVAPATDNNGFAIQTPTAVGTIAVTATAFFSE